MFTVVDVVLFLQAKTVYLPPAKESEKGSYRTFLTALEASSVRGHKKKTNMFHHMQTDRLPSSLTFTPSQREHNSFVFAFATEAHPGYLLTKREEGWKPKVRHLHCVCLMEHLVLGTFVVTSRELKKFLRSTSPPHLQLTVKKKSKCKKKRKEEEERGSFLFFKPLFAARFLKRVGSSYKRLIRSLFCCLTCTAHCILSATCKQSFGLGFLWESLQWARKLVTR